MAVLLPCVVGCTERLLLPEETATTRWVAVTASATSTEAMEVVAAVAVAFTAELVRGQVAGQALVLPHAHG